MNSDDNEFEKAFGPDGAAGMGMVGLPPQALAIMTALATAGQTVITGDEVEFTDGNKIGIPKGMTYEHAMAILEHLKQDSETGTTWDFKFNYKPDDGAHATYMVLRARYGAVLGKELQSLFGSRPAEVRNISIGLGQTMSVPFGVIEIPTLPDLTLMLCDAHEHPEYGKVFDLHVIGPKKYKDEVEAIAAEIEEYLRVKSIYRGKAILGARDPEFVDLSGVDPSKYIFADTVETAFRAGVKTVLRYGAAVADEGVSVKQANLLYGPHGTGKTSALQILAQMAVEQGWTVVWARTGEDDLEEAMNTARLYMPAMVIVEDIDVEASKGDQNAVRQLLETFDGVTAKGGQLIAVLTTNNVDIIHKGLMRPGRFDYMIEIDRLDRGGLERLIRAVVKPEKLSPDVDYDQVCRAMDQFTPAFAVGAVNRAIILEIAALGGQTNYMLTTDTLVTAAQTLRPQLELHEAAGKGLQPPDLEVAMGNALAGQVAPAVLAAMKGAQLIDVQDGQVVFRMQPARNGSTA